MGSALGYQCLFFAAMGIRCVGYEMIVDNMVGVAQATARKHGLAAVLGEAFRAGDARKAPLGSTGARALVWLNDEVWPDDVRDALLARAATELPVGSAVVSYGPPRPGEAPLPSGLRLVDSLRIHTSWYSKEEIRIFLRAD